MSDPVIGAIRAAIRAIELEPYPPAPYVPVLHPAEVPGYRTATAALASPTPAPRPRAATPHRSHR